MLLKCHHSLTSTNCFRLSSLYKELQVSPTLKRKLCIAINKCRMIKTIMRELKEVGMDNVSFGYTEGEESGPRFIGLVYVSKCRSPESLVTG